MAAATAVALGSVPTGASAAGGTVSIGAGVGRVIDSGITQTDLVRFTGKNASLTNNGTLDTTAQAGAIAVEGLSGFAGVTVTNNGTIASDASNAAVMLRGVNASVINHAGATISTGNANGSAVFLTSGGILTNAGTLLGHGSGVLIFGDGSITNSGIVQADRAGSAGISINYAATATLVNQAGGEVTGGLSGVKLSGGIVASLENAGTLRSTSSDPIAAAVRISGGQANIAKNLAGGRIEAVAGTGILMENGSVLNAHGATITAPTAIAITDFTQSAIVTNHGMLNGDVYMGSGNAALNLGADGVFNGKADAGKRDGAPTVVKTVALIGAEGGAAASATLAGAQLAGFDSLDVNAANAAWTLTGSFTHAGGTTLRAGRLNVASSAALGTGALAMDDGTTLGFAADGLVLANDVRFTGVADPTIDTGAFTGTLAGRISGAGELTKTGSGTLVLSGANTYGGATRVAQGTLRAGAVYSFSSASAHEVAAGATLDLAGFDQTLSALANGGTVSLQGAAPGTTLTVTGAYTGQNGVLRLGTALGGSASVSDRLVLDGAGASASGRTTVQVNNIGGLGALTAGNGIEVVSARNGATSTAQTTKDAFALANGHVDAGAYEYRLYAADASGAGENWYLRSAVGVAPGGPSVPSVPSVPSTPGVPGTSDAPDTPGSAVTPGAPAVQMPTYRVEVPLFAALPEQLRQANLAMLGNLHLRQGDDDATAGAAQQARRTAWGRVLSTDASVRQQGAVSPSSTGRLTGFQAGTDLFADTRWRAGLYVGQLDGDMSVSGFARGIQGLGVGRNDLRNQYVGGYANWTGESELYVDAVLQAGRHRYTVNPLASHGTSGKGSSLLASVEAGQPFAVASGWTVEPQLQLVRQRLGLDDTDIAGARVQQQPSNGWLARAGVRLKGQLPTGLGTLQPYVRLDLYRAAGGTDVARFVNLAASTGIASRTGHTSTALAGGASLALGERTSAYGEIGKLWASGGESRVASSVQASVGLRVTW